MKILMSTLLLRIAGFLNFGEIDAMGNPSEAYPHPNINRYPLFEHPVLLNHSPSSNNPEEPDRYVPYGPNGRMRIAVWLNPSGTSVKKASLGRGNYVPHGSYYRFHNFITRSVAREGLRFVEYVKSDGTILGVRAPRLNARKGQVEPNESTWFITYSGKNFKVKEDPATGQVEGITLLPANVYRREPNQHTLKLEEVCMGGIKFHVISKPDGQILGAELDRRSRP